MQPSTNGAREYAVTRLRQADAGQKEKNRELVAALRLLVRPGPGVRLSNLRRCLRLVGLHRATMHDIVLAMLTVSPAAYLARAGTGPARMGPRVIRGISLQVKPDALHGMVAAKYEVMLRESSLPPEPEFIEPEFKLGVISRAGRLSAKVVRLADRATDARAYQSVVEDYLHSNPWNRFKSGHKRIWQLHCQGVHERGISEEMGGGWSKTNIHRALDLHRARLGILP